MTRKKTIIKNTISNIGMQFLTAAIPFALLPFMLRYWGKETYGILVLAFSVLSFMYLLNGAIQMTLMKYVSEAYELKNFPWLNKIVNDFWLVAFLNNFVISCLLVLIGAFGLTWLNVPAQTQDTARMVFYIVGGFGIATGSFNILDGILVGLQKMHENNLFRAGEAVLSGLAAVTVLNMRLSLTQFVLLISCIPVMVRVAQFIYLKRILPEIHFNVFRYFDLKELMTLSRFSGYQVINQVSDLLMYNTDKLIIQKMLGAAPLVMYEVANKPNLLFQSFISLPLSAILPACSAAYARGDREFLDKMLVMGTRLYLVLVLPVIFAAIFSMRQFISLYLGKEYETAVPVAQLFLWTFAASCPFKVFSHMMVGKARVREYGLSKFVYAVINLPLSIFFIWKCGIIGGVIVTMGFWILVFVPVNLLIMSDEKIHIRRFLMSIAPLIAVISAEAIVVSSFFSRGGGASWLSFGAIIGGAISITMLLSFLFVLNKEERALIGVRV